MEHFIHFGIATLPEIPPINLKKILKKDKENFYPKIFYYIENEYIEYKGYMSWTHIYNWMLSFTHDHILSFSEPEDLSDYLQKCKSSIVYKMSKSNKLWKFFKAASAEFSSLNFVYMSKPSEYVFLKSNPPVDRISIHNGFMKNHFLFEGKNYMDLKEFILKNYFEDVEDLNQAHMDLLKNEGIPLLVLLFDEKIEQKDEIDFSEENPAFIDEETKENEDGPISWLKKFIPKLKEKVIISKTNKENFLKKFRTEIKKNLSFPNLVLIEQNHFSKEFYYACEENFSEEVIEDFLDQFSNHQLHYHIKSQNENFSKENHQILVNLFLIS